jgi:transposase
MLIMEIMERKQPRRRRSFAPEFKAEIVQWCRAGDRTIGQVARDFDLTETAVRPGSPRPRPTPGTAFGLTSVELAKLARLRRENRSLREDVEVLKRAKPPRNPRRQPSAWRQMSAFGSAPESDGPVC